METGHMEGFSLTVTSPRKVHEVDEKALHQPPFWSKSTPLFRLLDSHYEEFRNVYEERFSKRYGFWRPVTDEVVEKYLQCGDPHYGFARISCEECGTEYLRPFSCKCRGFCPSCSKRKSLDLTIFLEEELSRRRRPGTMMP